MSYIGGSGGSGSSGVVGGTFGASPSSGYTFNSTPITTGAFSGNLILGANTQTNSAGSYTAGAGYTLATSGANIALEYQVAGAASSYSAPITYSNASVWAGTIAVFANSGTPAKVQANTSAAGGVSTLAFASNNGSGNLLVAAIRYNSSTDGGPISSITDTNSNTWVFAGLRAPVNYSKGAGGPQYLEFWYALNSVAGANTITLHGLSANTNVQICVGEFSGVATSSALVDYNFNGSATAVTSMPGATTNNQYTINAVNNTTGTVDFTGRDSAVVWRSATANLVNVGGALYCKDGIYPGQTSLQENVAGLANWYVWSFPAPSGTGTQRVSWHLIGESFTGPVTAVNQQQGCIHQIMPSAYSGPAPSGTQLSGFWQRPNATLGTSANNRHFLENTTCRIPNNQVSSTICVDLFTSTYTYKKNIIVDTGFSPVDQTCSGLTPAVSNITGIRTNQSSTDETYFENVWVIGYNTPYSILSNHPFGLNMHSNCNQNAGNVNISASIYGGTFIGFQDNHNSNGLVLSCGNAGTRLDFLGTIVENTTGTFARVTNATEGTPGNCTGLVTVTTALANNGVINPSPFFASGSGTNYRVNESIRLVQPGLLTSNFTSAATTGTTKQTLATYTFVYNTNAGNDTLGPFQNNPGAVFRIKAWGIAASNTNSKVFEIDFGGTAIATITSVTTGGVSVKCEAEILVSSVANTQEIVGECNDGTTRSVLRTAPGITGNANIVLNVAATTATQAADFTFKGLTVEYVGGN